MAKITIKLRGEEYHLEAEEGQVLLDAILGHQIKYPHGCRVGSCGACRTLILKNPQNLSDGGTIEKITLEGVRLSHPGGIPTESTLRLACRGKILGDLELTPLI